LRSVAKSHQLSVFIETGAFVGDTISSLKGVFDALYSIELSPKYVDHCRKRFAKFNHINIILGDSRTELSSLLESEKRAALFWLDGHYSGGDTARGIEDSPVVAEIKAIINRNCKEDVICIDDAHLFVGKDGYPTISELQGLVSESGRALEIHKCIIMIKAGR
jgi:hypothetical protein